MNRFTTAEAAMSFIQSGRAIFTIKSLVTETRFTYKVEENENGRLFFVSVLNGPDNTSDYAYIGVIRDGVFRRTAKSRASETAPSFIAFNWTYGKLSVGQLPDKLAIWHCNKCGRCARPLTDPVSIEAGLGPECRKHVPVRPADALEEALACAEIKMGAGTTLSTSPSPT